MLPRLAVSFVIAASCAMPLRAQTSELPADAAAPAHVAHVEGAASLEREGRPENAPLNMPLLSGDRLRTAADGRIEVLFADGSTLHLDMRSTLDVQSDDLVRLTSGRLRLNIQGPSRRVAYRIDSPAGSARITQAGEYRVSLVQGSSELQLEVAVIRGAAELFTDEGSTPVRAGERAYASAGLAPSYAYAYNSAAWDAFDRWSESRRDVRLGVSSQYLPADMQSYAPVLDQDGDWRYTQSYGYAWYPRVASGWRPYYYGRWASYPQYGWTSIGTERFAWPTHHYGRWGFSAGVWFWTPSSRWAPAYVSWGYAPGYVSWCPLGFDNRPVMAIDLYRVGPGYYSPWRAWTAVPVSHFGSHGYYVHQRAVDWDRYDRGQRPHFETRPVAPGYSRDIAVPRQSTPIRWAGARDATGARALNSAAGSGSSAQREGLRPSTAGNTPVLANTAEPRGVSPRYVNRGDAIVRSSTERPSPRSATAASQSFGSVQGRPARDGYASPRYTSRPESTAVSPPPAAPLENRTMPAGPGRRVEPAPERVPYAGQARSRDEQAPGGQRTTNPVTSRAVEAAPSGSRAYDARGAYEPRGAYDRRGSYDPAAARPDAQVDRARPSPASPTSAAPAREAQPRAYDRPRAGGEAQPQRQSAPERAAPAERAAPSAAAPPPRAGGAVPRHGGGRGGV